MTTTRSRMDRRKNDPRVQYRATAKKIIALYDEDSVAGINQCHRLFGKNNFETILKTQLQRYSIRHALETTIIQCMEAGHLKNFKSEPILIPQTSYGAVNAGAL